MVTFIENRDLSIKIDNLDIESEVSSALQVNTLYRHEVVGKVFAIDEELQHVSAWYYLYHEPLIHIPCSFIRMPKRALVLGGGDLFAARELLRYDTIQEIILCEHDKTVIDIMCAHYAHAIDCINDNRLRIHFCDARVAISGMFGKFDLIINDCFDLVNHFNTKNENVFRAISDIMTDDGVCSDVIYRSIFDVDTNASALRAIKDFRHALSLMFIPEYPGCLHILTVWGRNKNIRQEAKRSINHTHLQWISDNPLQFFSPSHLRFHLYVPPAIKRHLAKL